MTQNGHFGHFGVTPRNPWIWAEIRGLSTCEQGLRIYPDFGLFSPIFGLYLAQNGPKWPKIGVVREGAQITLFHPFWVILVILG